MKKSVADAIKWLKERGGSCAIVRTKNGGRIYLAQGETGPFMPTTAKNMVEAGLADFEYNSKGLQIRLRLR